MNPFPTVSLSEVAQVIGTPSGGQRSPRGTLDHSRQAGDTGRMNCEDVFEFFRARAKPGAARTMRRHGVVAETWGVSFADIDAIARKIKVDQALARELWKTGHHDARMLATRIVDHAAMPESEAGEWIEQTDNSILADAVAAMVSRRPDAPRISRIWISSREEWRSAAGWSSMAELAMDGGIAVAEARELITRIVREIPGAPNRTRHAMNNALIAIGGSISELGAVAIEAAHAIGKVEVDHGQTGWVTPDAASHITRMAENIRGQALGPASGSRSAAVRPRKRT